MKGMIELSDQLTDSIPLEETEDINEARFVRVNKVSFKGCNLTEGKTYEIHRNYSNELFENGEISVIDDNGDDNYGILMLCKTTLYK
ncbi:MAG: hypothetical protein ACQEXX_01300 [Bacillota bacterium]